MSQRDGYFLVPFGPVPNAEPPAEERPDFGLGFAAELRGGVQWSFAGPTDSRPHAELSIPFAFWTDETTLCARILFGGISGSSLPRLWLESVNYNGSTLRLAPDAARLQSYLSDADRLPWTMVLRYPNRNLYPIFRAGPPGENTWPGPLISLNPPLGPDELPPIVRIHLVSGGGDDDPLVVPMRLEIDRGVQGRVTLRDLTREDSPDFTASTHRISARTDPLLSLTHTQTVPLVQDLDPGIYPVELVIGETLGAMTWRVECHDAPITRGANANAAPERTRVHEVGTRTLDVGSTGPFAALQEAHRLEVAQLHLYDDPWPFRLRAADVHRELSLSGTLRTTTRTAGTGWWVNPAATPPSVLWWSGVSVYRDQVLVARTAYWAVEAAALVTREGNLWVMLAGVLGQTVRIEIHLAGQPTALLVTETPLPRISEPSTRVLEFNQDATRLLYLILPDMGHSPPRNGAVFESGDLTPYLQIPAPTEALAWSTVADAALEDGTYELSDETDPETEIRTYGGTGAASQRLIVGAYYADDNSLFVDDLTLSLTWSHHQTAPYAEPFDIPLHRECTSATDTPMRDSWYYNVDGATNVQCTVSDAYGRSVQIANIDQAFGMSVGKRLKYNCISYGEDGPPEYLLDEPLPLELYPWVAGVLGRGYTSGTFTRQQYVRPRTGRTRDVTVIGPGTNQAPSGSGSHVMEPGIDVTVRGEALVSTTTDQTLPDFFLWGDQKLNGRQIESFNSTLRRVRRWIVPNNTHRGRAAHWPVPCAQLVRAETVGLGTTYYVRENRLWVDGVAVDLDQEADRLHPATAAVLQEEPPLDEDIPDWSPAPETAFSLRLAILDARPDTLLESGALNSQARALANQLAALPAEAPLQVPTHCLLSVGELDAQLAVHAWRRSETHRARLLDPAWRELGTARLDSRHGLLHIAAFSVATRRS